MQKKSKKKSVQWGECLLMQMKQSKYTNSLNKMLRETLKLYIV